MNALLWSLLAAMGTAGVLCTWAKLGLFGILAFFPSFVVFFGPKHGFANVRRTGFYSIPAGPSDHFFGKRPVWEMLLFTVYPQCED